MSTEPLTFEEALEAAEAAIAERGADFVYNERVYEGECAYVPSTDPRYPYDVEKDVPASGAAITGCLVGEIIKRTGRMTDDIAVFKGSVRTLTDEGLLAVDGGRTLSFLHTLQSEQDSGKTWGGALFHAKEEEEFRND